MRALAWLVLIAALAAPRVAAVEEADGWVPFTGMADQFTLLLPPGWAAFDQQRIATGKASPTGAPIIFTPEPLDPAAIRGSDQAAVERLVGQLSGIEVGRLPGFQVERQVARRGMDCAGFPPKAIAYIREIMASEPMFGSGRTVSQRPLVTPQPVGGCQGLEVRGVGSTRAGAPKHLDLYAVSDGKVLYLFKLLNTAEHRERNLGAFERAVASLRLAGR